MDLLIITSPDGEQHDYSQYITVDGYGWGQSIFDSDKSGRPKTLLMRRDVLGEKIEITYSVSGMTKAQIRQLWIDLKQTYFYAIVDDLVLGRVRKQFYCANFKAKRNTARSDGVDSWTAEPFTITER